MKILIVSQVFDDGYIRGAERVAMNVAMRLSDRNEVEILSLGDESGQDWVVGLPVKRLRFDFAPRPSAHSLKLGACGKMAWHLRNAWGGVSQDALGACLDAATPDVIYAHKATAFMPQLFKACADRGLPLVLHLHDYSTLCPRTTMFKSDHNCATACFSCRAFTASWRRHSRAVTDVIAVSAFVENRHRRQGAFPNARWHVVHNTDSSDLEGFVRKSSEGKFTFGFIGAVTPQKGFDDLIAAFAALPEDTSARLVVAGTGAEDYVFSSKEKLSGRHVEWLGHVNPNDFYSRVDCVIVPSRWHEPQALVISEALRRGLPVIASNRGGNSEVLGPRSGHMLYNPDTSGDLLAALIEMQNTRPEVPIEALNPEFYMMVEEILTLAAVKGGNSDG